MQTEENNHNNITLTGSNANDELQTTHAEHVGKSSITKENMTHFQHHYLQETQV